MTDVMHIDVLRERAHARRLAPAPPPARCVDHEHVWIELGRDSGRWVRVGRRRGPSERLRDWLHGRAA